VPVLELYASPVNFDPEAPMFPISAPPSYARELAESSRGWLERLGLDRAAPSAAPSRSPPRPGRLTAHDPALGLERSIERVVALSGVLQAGAASGPRAPGSPPARRACRVADADAARRRAHPFVPAPAEPGFFSRGQGCRLISRR
ncbi:MAG: hypothetical protein ACRELA_11660, partial [Candidatus Rokuibacteriota bacterium]